MTRDIKQGPHLRALLPSQTSYCAYSNLKGATIGEGRPI